MCRATAAALRAARGHKTRGYTGREPWFVGSEAVLVIALETRIEHDYDYEHEKDLW